VNNSENEAWISFSNIYDLKLAHFFLSIDWLFFNFKLVSILVHAYSITDYIISM
jgi:hypothetical protein